MNKKELSELMDRIDDMENTQVIVNNIIQYKEFLTSIPQDNLLVTQKLWLLANEASEDKLAKMGELQDEESKKDFVLSMLVLNDSIPEK